MAGNGVPVTYGRFDEFEKRMEERFRMIDQALGDLRAGMEQKEVSKGNKRWSLFIACLTGILIPLIVAAITAIVATGI